MNRRSRKERLVAEINITPFTDVMLVLLIIFMIATPLIAQSSVQVNLPKAKSARASANNQQSHADITITKEGVVYLDGKPLTKKELEEQIKIMYSNNPGLSVTVRSDRSVRFQKIVDVVDPLAELGITKLNIAAINE